MKKAGILTFHRALNYGAVLQCYALKQTLQRLGFEADVIDYRQKDIEKQHRLRAIAKPRWFLKHLVTLSLHRFIIGAYRCLKTQHMFNCFVQKHLSPKSTCKDSEHISTGYDLYVIGSDQLWNKFLTGNKFDKVYCGFFTRDSGSKVITYAVSSNSQALNQQDDTLRRTSTNFDEISIREKSLCDLFEKETGYKTRCDLDPTLLAPPTIWDNLTNTKWEGRNYILIYEVRHKKGGEDTLRIHIGEVSGDQFIMNAKDTWRVSPDGCIRDTFGTLSRVFMMPEQNFFEHYTDISAKPQHSYYDAVNKEIHSVANHMQELPFSNIWIAQQMSGRLPNNCELHFGIYHSLRSWNFFKLPPNILAKCNVGGFGIDGGMSSMIGASLASPEKTFIGVFGDLAFFYDMNVVGNRHVGNNVRILLINNGKGNEFRNYNHPCSFLGDEADEYIAAAHHFGDKSPKLVRDYATDLGYKYLTASNKAQFMESLDSFLSEDKSDAPMIFEVFTETQNESLALEMTLNTMSTIMEKIKETIKNGVKDAVGASRVDSIKKIISKL